MYKIKFLITRIINLDYKNMFNIAKKISKKTKKNIIFIIVDIIYCGIKYQAGYYDYLEFEFYNLKSSERKTFITRGINNEIIRKYNDKASFYKFDDKIEFNKIFKDYLKRDYLYLEDFEEFKKFVKGKKEFIAKPIDGEGGFGIEKIEVTKDLKNTFDYLIENKKLLVEEVIIQHEDMNKLYSKSVNTLRMFTFYKDGKSNFLYAILKIGNGGVIDNFASGGMYTTLDNNGIAIVPAIDKNDDIYYKHPVTDTEIVGFSVPLFDEAVELVKKAAQEVKEISYIGWDVAISEDGPVIVEGNCFPGIFQIKASLNKEKKGLLCEYKKFMDI